MEGMYKVKGLKELDLYQNPQAELKNKMRNFDEEHLQKAYARAQGKYDETVTIAIGSRQIGAKSQTRTKIAPPSGFNIALDE